MDSWKCSTPSKCVKSEGCRRHRQLPNMLSADMGVPWRLVAGIGVGFRKATCRGRGSFHNVIAVGGPGHVDLIEDALLLSVL